MASSDSSLGNPDRQVFMAAGDTPGTSGMAHDKYLEDSSPDELSAEAPAMRPTPTRTLDVSETEDGTNDVGVSETAYPSATLRRPSNKSRAGYTPPPSNATC
jgi:hypothetical protein